MSHTVGAATANYLWDVNRGVPEILQDGTNTYVYGLGRISATDGSGNQTYYDTDGLGSTADLTNSSAAKTDGYTYDAFGAPTHSPGSSTQPFQFTGQQTDTDSGMQYLRARYYDSSTGRFLSKDPFHGFADTPASQHSYVYARNNPVNLTDPTGRASERAGEGITIRATDLNGLVSGLVDAYPKAPLDCVRDLDWDCIHGWWQELADYQTWITPLVGFLSSGCGQAFFSALSLIPAVRPFAIGVGFGFAIVGAGEDPNGAGGTSFALTYGHLGSQAAGAPGLVHAFTGADIVFSSVACVQELQNGS